jgi:hypothetical protein
MRQDVALVTDMRASSLVTGRKEHWIADNLEIRGEMIAAQG